MSKRRAIGQGSRPRGKNWPGMWQAGAAARARRDFTNEHPRGSATSKQIFGDSYETASRPQRDLRKTFRYKGPGDYKSTWKKYRKYVPRGLGAAAGYGLGYGAKAGYGAGARLSKAIGWGDYSMNQIVSGPVDMNPHQNVHHVGVAKDLSGDIIYCNTEFVKNVYVTGPAGVGTSTFQVDSLPLNPAMQETFPFLSQIAQNFELFEFQGLMFQYKPNSGTFGNSNSNSLGKVVLCTNYDPDATSFSSAIVMENYDYACSTLPSEGCLHGVECLPSQRSTNQLYTRTGTSSKDLVFTDLGKFQIATEGVPFGAGGQTALVGELWVTYTVKLSRAKLEQITGNSILHATYRGTGSVDFGANMANSIADGDNTTTVTFEDVSNVQARATFNDNLKGRRVQVVVFHSVTLTGGSTPSTATFVNCTLVSSQKLLDAGLPGMIDVMVIDLDEASTSSSFLFGSTVAPAAATVCEFTVTVVDPQYNVVVA